jgi:hypothetical protein
MSLREFARRAARASFRGAVIGACAGFAVAASAADTFKVRLTPVPIEAANAATTTGIGAATASLDGTRLTLTGNFTGLKGPATVAHLHAGAMRGVRGPSFADVTVPQTPSGDFRATLTLTPAQAEELRQGHVYLQIHSSSAPDGNLWGWLLP